MDINEFFDNYTLLHYACNTRTDTLIEALIGKGANINCITSDIRRATALQLYLSSEHNSFPSAYIVKLLCSSENINHKDFKGYTALFYASSGWWHNDLFPEIVNTLLSYGAEPNETIATYYCINNFKEGCANNRIYYDVAFALLSKCNKENLNGGNHLREIAIKNRDIQLYSIINKVMSSAE